VHSTPIAPEASPGRTSRATPPGQNEEDIAMLTYLFGAALTALPILAVAALLWLSDRVHERRRARYARQIALTDAIHRELGAVAAPMVSRRRAGGWRVTMAAPLDSPAMVGALVRIADRVSRPWGGSGAAPVEIVLTPGWAGRSPAATGSAGMRHAAMGAAPLATSAR